MTPSQHFNAYASRNEVVSALDYMNTIMRDHMDVAMVRNSATFMEHLCGKFLKADRKKSTGSGRVIALGGEGSQAWPVVEFDLPNGMGKAVGVKNKFGLTMSFELTRPLPQDTFGRVGPVDRCKNLKELESEIPCGIPSQRFYGSFAEDAQRFTIWIREDIYTSNLAWTVMDTLIPVLVEEAKNQPIPLFKKMEIKRK